MWKYVAVTVAAFYLVLTVYGDESRRQEVSRSVDAEDTFSFGALIQPASVDTPSITVATLEPLPEEEAVARAIQAGRQYRETRTAVPLLGTIAPTPASVLGQDTATSKPAEALPVVTWQVTGSRVNLRAGPSTSDAVVGQLVRGTEAEVLNQGDGWYQIQTSDGAYVGWIFGKFLAQKG